MNYAIIQLAGKQYRLSEGDTLTVDRQFEDTIKTDAVLLLHNDQDIKVGTPKVAGATVTLQKVEDIRGDKLRVFKFKAKSRYRRTQGHRQEQSVLKVTKIARS